jgi:hypothetical protein
MIKKKIIGAWLIHHTTKLQSIQLTTSEYEQISFAGKCGILISALAGSKEATISDERVKGLASANRIHTRIELPTILQELQRQRLIDIGESEIVVLGLTSDQTLEHTTTIYEESTPQPVENAAIEISERISDAPLVREDVAEYISDTYKVATQETSDILDQFEQIGFFDFESVDKHKLYFNGNLFRREDANKIDAVISSLTTEERGKVIEFIETLKKMGCVPERDAKSFLGDALYSKLCSIGMLDQNSIGNETGTYTFITRPAAFSKFTNTAADDAFDLAKAFVTSLTYGMTKSPYSRGRIVMVEALMRKLINGEWVGPATAIGHDYKVLELRGVIVTKAASNGLYYMRLLKKEVGELALRVVTEGEASSSTLTQLPEVSAIRYEGPEANRMITRKNQGPSLKKGVANLLMDIRTGGLR